MHEVTTGSSMPPAVQTDPAANVRARVTVYFPGGEQNLLYVQVNGQWVEYVKAAPPPQDQKPAALTLLPHPTPDTDTRQNARPGPDPRPGPDACPGADARPGPAHWAGYTCHSPHEITRDRKRRVYHDPATRPDLFIAGAAERPALPLPVLDFIGDREDTAPWLDPGTGERFSPEQASMVMKLLRYAPR